MTDQPLLNQGDVRDTNTAPLYSNAPSCSSGNLQIGSLVISQPGNSRDLEKAGEKRTFVVVAISANSTQFKIRKQGGCASDWLDTDQFEFAQDINNEAEPAGMYTHKFQCLQVTIRRPCTFLSAVAVFYGFAPLFAPPLFVLWDMFHGRSFLDFAMMCLGMLATLFNETICKPRCNNPRPQLTANVTRTNVGVVVKYGMPSGHCYTSYALMVWMLLEILVSGPGSATAAARRQTAAWCVVVLFVLLPVPWARWHNKDHTFRQCAVGSFLGILTGYIFYNIRHHYLHHWYVGPFNNTKWWE